jgi:hypothetical protein
LQKEKEKEKYRERRHEMREDIIKTKQEGERERTAKRSEHERTEN